MTNLHLDMPVIALRQHLDVVVFCMQAVSVPRLNDDSLGDTAVLAHPAPALIAVHELVE